MIRLLPEPQQEVVQPTFFKGLTQREIAAQNEWSWPSSICSVRSRSWPQTESFAKSVFCPHFFS
jgi:hypothetical protein